MESSAEQGARIERIVEIIPMDTYLFVSSMNISIPTRKRMKIQIRVRDCTRPSET